MIVTYLIFLITAIVFRLLHFPGSSLFFVFSPLFMITDIIIQSIRKKGDKETNIWSAVSLLFLSLYISYKFMNWPGSIVWLLAALIISIVYFTRVYQKKIGYQFRFYLVSLLFLFAVLNSTMSGSSFRMFYMLEDPFDESVHIPHFYLQKLAFDFYNEGEYDKAEKLIEKNIKHLNELIVNDNQPQIEDYWKDLDIRNLEQSQNDLNNIQKRSWTFFEPLFPEDRQIEK